MANEGEPIQGGERGPYEVDETRPPLRLRHLPQTWTAMEREVFNAVTQHWDRGPRKPLFSARLRVVQAMLEAFDKGDT
jgi:hypothetical protein